MRSRSVTGTPAVEQTHFDDLLTLLPDWQIHLRARNVSPSTIVSYLRVSRAFDAFLQENGLPRRVSHITRDHVETYLASMFERPRSQSHWIGQTRHSR